jgi:hypothetical protein
MRLTTAVVLLLGCSVDQGRVFADASTKTALLEKEGLASELASSQKAAARAERAVIQAVGEPNGGAVGLRASGRRRVQEANDEVTEAPYEVQGAPDEVQEAHVAVTQEDVQMEEEATDEVKREKEDMEDLSADLLKLEQLEKKVEQGRGRGRGNDATEPPLPKGAKRVKHGDEEPEAPDGKMPVPRRPKGLKTVEERLHNMVDAHALEDLSLKLDRNGKAIKPTLPENPSEAEKVAFYEKMALFYAEQEVADDFDNEPLLDTTGLPVMPQMPEGPVDSRTKTEYDKAVVAYYKKMAAIGKNKVDPDLAVKMGWNAPSGSSQGPDDT